MEIKTISNQKTKRIRGKKKKKRTIGKIKEKIRKNSKRRIKKKRS